jgi:hypothetical protein
VARHAPTSGFGGGHYSAKAVLKKSLLLLMFIFLWRQKNEPKTLAENMTFGCASLSHPCEHFLQ